MNIHESYRAVVDKTHERIIKFRDMANEYLQKANMGSEQPVPYFWYSGQFISGDICNPKILILSMNPGGGSPEPLKPCYFRPRNNNGSELKYFDEYKADYQFAKNLVKYIFDEEIEMLRACAETYAYSPFASTGVPEIDRSLGKLDMALNKEHHVLAGEIVVNAIEKLNPEKIIISGNPAFENLKKKTMEINPSLKVVSESEWIDGVVRTGKLANGSNLFVSYYHLSAPHFKGKKELVLKHANSFLKEDS